MKTNQRIIAGLAAAAAALVSVPVSADRSPDAVKGRVMRRRRRPAGRRVTPDIRLKPGARKLPGKQLKPAAKPPRIRATDQPPVKPGLRNATETPGGRMMQRIHKPGIRADQKPSLKPGLRAIEKPQ